MECQLHLLPNAPGSARFTFLPNSFQNSSYDAAVTKNELSGGSTCVLAAVHGPLESKLSRELSNRVCTEVTFRPSLPYGERLNLLSPAVGTFSHNSGLTTQIEDIVKRVCDTSIRLRIYARSSLQVHLQEVYSQPFSLTSIGLLDDPTLIACAVNSTCGALLAAGVQLDCTFAAVPCALLDTDTPGETQVVLASEQQRLRTSSVRCLATAVLSNANCRTPAAKQALLDTEPASNGYPSLAGDLIAFITHSGRCTPTQLVTLVRFARRAAVNIFESYETALRSNSN